MQLHRVAYYADLTAYEYNGSEPGSNVLNVGWLAPDHHFERAEPSQDFIAKLRKLAAAPTNLFRGSHLCEFCPPPPNRDGPGGLNMVDPAPGSIGNGEVRVRYGDVIYVAPMLILHYVEQHHYSPPQEFVRAVLKSD